MYWITDRWISVLSWLGKTTSVEYIKAIITQPNSQSSTIYQILYKEIYFLNKKSPFVLQVLFLLSGVRVFVAL